MTETLNPSAGVIITRTWKGYSAAVMRAIPANGAGFLAYEQVRSIFVRMDDE